MPPERSYFDDGHGENASESCLSHCIYGLSITGLIICFPISVWFCVVIIREYQRIIILRTGKLQKKQVKGPGVVFLIPCLDEYQRVDLRTECIDVPTQETMTKDSMSLQINAVVYYRIIDPLAAVMAVSNYRDSTELLAMTTLRNVIGQKTLTEVITERIPVSNTLLKYLDEGTGPWGIKVERVEMLDISIPEEMQLTIAQESQAIRAAKAKVIKAQGELKASRILKKASDVLENSTNALTLRYLQTVNTMAIAKPTTIYLPVPMELGAPFFGRK